MSYYLLDCFIIHQQAIKDSNMAIIKKSLLFTVHIVDNKITCVRSNLTGKFIKKSVYIEIVNSVKGEYTTFTEWQRIDVIKYITKIPYIGFALCSFFWLCAFIMQCQLSKLGNKRMKLLIAMNC